MTTQTNITPFDFEDNMIRAHLDEHGNPWFVASDIAKALGYERPNDAVNAHCKKVNKISYGKSPQPYNIIPESDMFRLIMRSNLPSAERFQDWVFEEVLPSLRKTGSYAMPHMKKNQAKISRTCPMPEEIPEIAYRLSPAKRQRLWRDALDSARMDGGGTKEAIYWFEKLCELMTEPASTDMVTTPETIKIHEFFSHCCERSWGDTVRSNTLYEAMRRWNTGRGGDMPSMRVFGSVMVSLAERIRSNGIVYKNIRLK